MDERTATATQSDSTIATTVSTAARELGLTPQEFSALRRLDGFPGRAGHYPIDEIREWLRGPVAIVPGDAQVRASGTVLAPDDPPAVALTGPTRAEHLVVPLPLAEPTSGTFPDTCLGRIDLTLRAGPERLAFRRLFAGLLADQATLPDGRPVSRQADVVRWLLGQVAAHGPRRNTSR